MSQNEYYRLIKRQQEEMKEFPMFFAFSAEQYVAGKEKLGVEFDHDLIHLKSGGFLHHSSVPALQALLERHRMELQTAIAEDETGEDFIYEMFYYELLNHEYAYTEDLDETLDALQLNYDMLHKQPALMHGLNCAISQVIAFE